MVRRLARRMGGDLTVASDQSGGSRFRLAVLVDHVEAGDTSLQNAAAPARSTPFRALDLLCVEDNPYGRVVLNTILSELGHRVDFVGTGEAAIETLGRRHYDAVLMDVTLPGVDGFEATRRIRALASPASAIPIIGISGRASSADAAAGLVAGMNSYLAKPLSPSALAQVLAQVTAS
jgi:CheY-like chemotaxis protein